MDDHSDLKKCIEAVGMDPSLINLEHVMYGKVVKPRVDVIPLKEPEKPPEKKKVFNWRESIHGLTGMLKTGQPQETRSTHKEKKHFRWPEKTEGAKEVAKSKKEKQRKPLPPADFCYTGLDSFVRTVIDPTRPIVLRSTKEAPKVDHRGMFVTTSARFAHNNLTSMNGLDSFLEARFAEPSRIEWLDLSYNRICEIESALSVLPRLKTLYLHCNCFDDFDEIRKLRFVTSLHSLTLFGNPIEAMLDYRLKVIAALPHLKRLDWGIVTPREKEMSQRFHQMMVDKDLMEAEQLKKELEAAAAKKEKQLKEAEKRKRRAQKEVVKDDAEKEGKTEQKTKEKENEEALKKEAADLAKEFEENNKAFEEAAPIIQESPDADESSIEEEGLEEEEETIIFPADIADFGPLDVKGKYKLNPDPLDAVTSTDLVRRSKSRMSLFSSGTVNEDEILEQFRLLKELEADENQDYYDSLDY